MTARTATEVSDKMIEAVTNAYWKAYWAMYGMGSPPHHDDVLNASIKAAVIAAVEFAPPPSQTQSPPPYALSDEECDGYCEECGEPHSTKDVAVYMKQAKSLPTDIETPQLSNAEVSALLAENELHAGLIGTAVDDIAELRVKIDNLKDMLCLADEALMRTHGSFPLDRATPSQRYMNDACMAIRTVTGEKSFDARGVAAQRALARYTGQLPHPTSTPKDSK